MSGTSSLPERSENGVGNRSFDRWRSIKSVGRIVKNEDGVAGIGLKPVLTADRETILGIRANSISPFYDSVNQETYPPQSTATLVSPLDGRASFDTIEVSGLTGMSPKTLRKYAALGYIPGAFQPAGKWSGWRFKRKELEAWWQSMGSSNCLTRRR